MKEDKENNQESVEQLAEVRFGTKLAEFRKMFAPRQLTIIEVEGKMAVLKPITASEMAKYSMILADEENGGLDKSVRYLLETLWLDGDEELRNDEEYFISAMPAIQNVIVLKKSRSAKL